ncbi:MAG: hypothetical protein ACI8P9_002539 [Parasphingorhabdus sp.]|jgi:hypothetical protein
MVAQHSQFRLIRLLLQDRQIIVKLGLVWILLNRFTLIHQSIIKLTQIGVTHGD